MTNVLIVEDQKMIRGLLEMYVKNHKEYRLVQSVSKASLALDECEKHQVDLVLMDVLTEDNDSGLEATRTLKEHFPQIKVVIVTSLLDDNVLKKAKEVCADSLWYKDVSEGELMDVVERTVAGEKVFPETPPCVKVGNCKSSEFTKTEKRVLRLLIRGCSYAEMAETLGVSTDTVKYHVSNMLNKTGCKNKLQLSLAVQNAKLIIEDI